jgi:hypothetical protein
MEAEEVEFQEPVMRSVGLWKPSQSELSVKMPGSTKVITAQLHFEPTEQGISFHFSDLIFPPIVESTISLYTKLWLLPWEILASLPCFIREMFKSSRIYLSIHLVPRLPYISVSRTFFFQSRDH